MLLSALLLAAAVQAAPPVSPSEILAQDGPVTVHAFRDGALMDREACQTSGLQLADQPLAAKPQVKRLGDLPPANHTLTVLRSVDGCPVSSTVRFNVDLSPRR